MSDDKSNPKLNLEQMLKGLKPDDYKTENEGREWFDSSVGKELIGPDKKESVVKGHEQNSALKNRD